MVKHNNVIPNQHFKKKWQFYVRTWFNQPARKKRRSEGKAHLSVPGCRSCQKSCTASGMVATERQS